MARTTPRTLTWPITATCLLAIGSGTLTTRADDKPPVEPAARVIMEKVAAAYQALPAYSDQGELVAVVRADGKATREVKERRLNYQRPNKIALLADPVALVGDGKSTFTKIQRKLNKADGPARWGLEQLTSNPAAAVFFEPPIGQATLAVFLLLATDGPLDRILDGSAKVTLQPDKTWSGKTYHVIRFEPGQAGSISFLIDPKTYLIQRAEMTLPPEATPAEVQYDELAWNAGEIRTTPDDSAFRLETEGLNPVGSLAEMLVVDAPNTPQPGQPAPEFSLKVLDGSATRLITPAELAGKVVIINFWATWCGPCKRELPELQKLVQELKAGPRAGEVVVLTVSLDGPEPGSDQKVDVPKLVRDSLKARNLAGLQATPVGFVGLDPDQELARELGIQGVPSTLVIGPKGIVSSFRVGAVDDAYRRLSQEIGELLGPKRSPSN